MDKILIIQLRRIGDVVFTLPVAEILRKHFPQAQIDFLVEEPAAELVRLNPYLTQTLVYKKEDSLDCIFQIRKRKYDCVLDFHSNGRALILTLLSGSKMKAGFKGALTRNLVYTHSVEARRDRFIVDQKIDLLSVLNIKNEIWRWNLNIPEANAKDAELYLCQKGWNSKAPLIAFAPIHRHPIRAWKKAFFIETANDLSRRHKSAILLLGGPGEENEINGMAKEIREPVIPCICTSLIQMASLMKKCKCLIANDNGPQKIAMALNVPSITIFGPTNPKAINLNRPPHLALRDEQLFCIGCELIGCPYHHECMERITPDMVLAKAGDFLKNDPLIEE